MLISELAQICHEANRIIQLATNDPAPSPHWEDAPEWQQTSAINGVEKALSGATPKQLHDTWCDHKRAEGWTYGPVKDPIHLTHPCLVEYHNLPEEQKLKDQVFGAIVTAIATQITTETEGK